MTGNMAELGLSAESFLFLLQPYNLFSRMRQSFPPLAVTYVKVIYVENDTLSHIWK
jgi:hypothetical protein